jgi:hypothetical protein
MLTTNKPPAALWPDTLSFELPAELEASAPPEARGLRRDEVRLLVLLCQIKN